MTGASNHYASQKPPQPEWTRYTGLDMEIGGSPEDARRTWHIKLPDMTILTSSYAYLPKDSLKNYSSFNIIILDGDDRKVAETLNDHNIKNVDPNRVSYNSICHLRSMYHFNQRMMMATGQQKKLYWRVIPEIDLGNETRGPEEARILTEGLWEILFTIRERQGRPLRTDDDRVGALEVKYNSSELNTIPLSELEEILEDFDIDKSMITLIDDPMHVIAEREAHKIGCPVKTYNLVGQPIMSFNQAMLFLTEALICGVDWRRKTVQQKNELWQFIEQSMEPIISTNHYIPYSTILKRIIEYKRANQTMYADQIPLGIFLIQHERPGFYLKNDTEYQECAVRFCYDKDVFSNRNTQIWQLRVQGIFGAVQMFIEGVDACNYLDMTIRDALMFMISPPRRKTYRSFFDEEMEIFDLDQDGDERCRVMYKLENRKYEFHFHNNHTIRGTRSRRKVLKYLPKFTKYVLHGCAPKSTAFETKIVRRRCRRCRLKIKKLDKKRSLYRQKRNKINNFLEGERDRCRHLRDQMRVIRAKKRELERIELLRAMPAQNQKMEFELNSYRILLPLMEEETRKEQEKCEEAYRKNQELKMEEARLMSQLEVEDILNLCFNKKDGRAPGIRFGPNQPLWVPKIDGLTDDLDCETVDSATKKDYENPRIVRQVVIGKARNNKKEAPGVYTDDMVERFLETELSGGMNRGGKKKERCFDYSKPLAPSTSRKSRKLKTAKPKRFKMSDPQSLETYVTKIKEMIAEVEEQKKIVGEQTDQKKVTLPTTVNESPVTENPVKSEVKEMEPEPEVENFESQETLDQLEVEVEVQKEEVPVANAEKPEGEVQNGVPASKSDSEAAQDPKEDQRQELISKLTEEALQKDQAKSEILVDNEKQNQEVEKMLDALEDDLQKVEQAAQKVQDPNNEAKKSESSKTALEGVKMELESDRQFVQKQEAPPTEATSEDVKEVVLEQPKEQEPQERASKVSELQAQEVVTAEAKLDTRLQKTDPEVDDEWKDTPLDQQGKALEASELSKVEELELKVEELEAEAQPDKNTPSGQPEKIPEASDLPKAVEESEMKASEVELEAPAQDQIVLDVVEGLLVPLQLAEAKGSVSDEVDGLEQKMKSLDIKDEPQDLKLFEPQTSGTSENSELEEETTVTKKLDQEEPVETFESSKTLEDQQKENQTPEVKVDSPVSTTVTPIPKTAETQLSQPCSSSSIALSKKPMEPIQLNYMEHQDPAVLIQQLFEEMKDSKSRPSKIQVDVRNKEIDEKDLTSPSSVPEDPATSWKTLKMLSNQKHSPSFELVIQSQAAIQEKDRKIEELERLCQALEAKHEQMELQMIQNQPCTSATSTETQLKLELLEKDAKISELEDSNRELQLKIKHQEEFIDKLLKR